MKRATLIAAAILGLAFVFFGMVSLLGLRPKGTPPPEGSAVAMFFGAFGPTGWLTMVKVFEVLGGILTAIPKTRVWGLLILGPIIVNILAFKIFAAGGNGLFEVPVIVVTVLGAFLLFAERHAFLAMLKRPAHH